MVDRSANTSFILLYVYSFFSLSPFPQLSLPPTLSISIPKENTLNKRRHQNYVIIPIPLAAHDRLPLRRKAYYSVPYV
jgi:hypothetical protein